MAGPEAPQRATNPPSLLPVPAKFGRPSTVPPPQLSLAPTWQSNGSLAVSGTPVRSSISISTSSGSKTPGSGLPSLRSLKSLLPFGSNKSSTNVSEASGNSVGSQGSKGSSPCSGQYGSVRRSMATERTYTTPPSRDNVPQSHLPRSASLELRKDYPHSVFHSSPAVTSKKTNEPEPRLSPSYGTTGGDLSTIIESDTSGISKHLPDRSESEVEDTLDLSLRNNTLGSNSPYPSPAISITSAAPFVDRCRHPHVNKSLPPSPVRSSLDPSNDLRQTVRRTRSAIASASADASIDEPDHSLLYVLQGVRQDDETPSSGTTSRRTSFLDLSTANLKDEVRDALANIGDLASLSHEAVILDDLSSSKEPSPSPGFQHTGLPDPNEPSFDLERVDPELAALLSPNSIPHGEPSRDIDSDWALRTSSPPPRHFSAVPLSKSSSLPRPSTSPGEPSPPPSFSTMGPSRTNTLSASTVRRGSAEYARPRQSPSPLASEFGELRASSSSSRRPRTSGGEFTLRPSSRTQMDRPPLRAYHTVSASADTFSSARATPSRASAQRLLNLQLGYIEDKVAATPNRTVRAASFAVRTRKRSSSAAEAPRPGSASGRPALEWLGPRTAKAFAAAGLIDQADRASDAARLSGRGSLDRARYTPSRASSERDWRSVGTAPSRMTFSELEFGGGAGGSVAGGPGLRSTSSVGRNSGSRHRGLSVSVSERGYLGGSVMDTPGSSISHGGRSSAFSGRSVGSGSPSAGSARSDATVQMQALKDKHAAEMEALLSALQDSQRLTKMLRSENDQLRARIEGLEDDLGEAMMELNQRRALDREPPSPDTPPSSRTRERVHYDVSPSPRGRDNIHQDPPLLRKMSLSLSPQGSPLKQSVRGKEASTRFQSFTPPESSTPFEVSPLEHLTPAAESSHFIPRNDDIDDDDEEEERDFRTNASSSIRRRRSSTPSSLFPVLPSNMSMLINERHQDETVQHDDSGFQNSPSPPASPTLVLPPLPSTSMHYNRTIAQPGGMARASIEMHYSHHLSQKSMSSAGNISPTTANFSMYSIGSPGSLNLRPEHEVHLDDMSALDLAVDG